MTIGRFSCVVDRVIYVLDIAGFHFRFSTSSGLFPAISGESVASTPMPEERFASIWQRWTMLPSVRPAR
jgi:hypothetical protein